LPPAWTVRKKVKIVNYESQFAPLTNEYDGCNNAKKLVATLCESGKLTESDILELRDYCKVKGGDDDAG
jgi:hypothetical protein